LFTSLILFSIPKADNKTLILQVLIEISVKDFTYNKNIHTINLDIATNLFTSE